VNNIALLSSDFNIIKFWYKALKDKYNTEIIATPADFIAKKDDKNLLIIDIQTTDSSDVDFFLTANNVQVLIIGDSLSGDEQIKMIVDGASGYAEKSTDFDLIPRVVESVLKNEIWLGRRLIPRMVASLAQKTPVLFNEDNLTILSDLTGREMEVIKYIYCGECNHAIAGKMNISIRTVKAHLAAIYRKLNVEDRFQLVIKLKDAHLDAFSSPQ
jgi:DNA-binding NarL/FixJ family response regulator